MSEQNDPEEFQTHHEEYLEKQKDLVKEELHEEHANLILDFLYDRKGDLAPSTARNYARELRFIIKHTYDKDYPDVEEWESDVWERLIRRVAREREIGDGTKRNTCYAVRAFIEWSTRTPASKEEIDAPKIVHSKIDENVVLKPDEVVKIIEKAHTARDKAIISVMYECALRRTALVQLDIGDYKTDRFNRIRIPHKEGVKTGHGRERPLNWSAGYLDSWLTNHPDPENDDAPLFCSIREGRDAGERLSSHSIYTIIKRIADEIDEIDSDRIHPHALRHSRATAMRKSENLDKRDIETVMGWTESTPMHGRYEHTTSTEDATRTAKRMGVEIGTASDERAIEDCPRCNSKLPPNAQYCPTCTLKISGEPPEWWTLFKEIAKDTDPIKQEYDTVVSAIPRLDELNIQELDHIHTVLLIGDTLLYDEENIIEEHPYDGVSGFESEEKADKSREIIEKIKDNMAGLYEQSPENVELVKDSIDIENIKTLSEQREE
jgi:site-specific recombinase XerC